MSFGAQFLTQGPEPLLKLDRGWGRLQREIHLPFGTCHFLHLTEDQHRGLDSLDVRTAPLSHQHMDIEVRSAEPGFFRDIVWDGRNYELEFDYGPDRVSWAGDGFLVELDLGDGPGACRLWTRIDDPAHFAGVVQNLLRIVTAYRLLEAGGLLLHSAGIRVDDGAMVFFGISGAGKSTVAAAAVGRGNEVFSDDLNAVFPVPDGYVVAAVPFTGDLDKSTTTREQLPLTALYRLRQSDRNRVVPLTVSEAVARLAVCAPYVNVDANRQARLLDVLMTLASAIPPNALEFQKPVDFWGEVL